MVTNNLKLGCTDFKLYTLQIGYPTTSDKIKAKLQDFSNFEQDNRYINLDFDSRFDFEAVSDLVLDLSETAKLLKLELHSILYHDGLMADSIFGVPVITLPEKTRVKPVTSRTLIVDEPIRGGIVIENDGDIVVTSFVSDDAEIIATGNIHVYGEARGKLIAGKKGNKDARIFVASFSPKLIAIGGIYRVIDEPLPDNIKHKSVMIQLDDKDRLSIIPIVNSNHCR
jgi:septum site-determining protein MinC